MLLQLNQIKFAKFLMSKVDMRSSLVQQSGCRYRMHSLHVSAHKVNEVPKRATQFINASDNLALELLIKKAHWLVVALIQYSAKFVTVTIILT